ncbi:hypothetical protein Poli38472_004549 [Pythium oligandrum]|uniref:Uncharacterized protein n=1 Tax=Pythium oligandrum TaxID=41045 RepID=A0A8K1CAZ3_PYTOL|nr:hypothetical protein Poli38472_004549 [Pythium oligandrum]|eukprot:TMW59480.1 hypothetical protein Poli38472_004549 [Pythium oligandrum]
MATIESVHAQLLEAEKRLAAVEKLLDERESVRRVQQHLQRAKLSSAFLKTAPGDYYSWKLEQRGEFLQCSVPHLCKSIIVDNTACTNAGMEDPLNSRYYCVVLQYNSKLNGEQLMRFVRSRIPEKDRPGRKAFNFQHASGEVAEQLTGFKFNGVSTFGMKTQIPVIVSGAVAALEPPFLWLGGGSETVKLRISVQELLSSLSADVAPELTTLRDDLQQEDTTMASRLDLEARLRALREPKGSMKTSTQPPTSPATSEGPPAAPAPPRAETTSAAPQPMARTSPMPPRFNYYAFSGTTPTPPKPQPVERPPVAVQMPPPPQINVSAILGPAYDDAVTMAQFAIESERKQLVHTSIDAYIRAGQAFIAIGRQQTVPHLQTILKTKALALLQRAEGLEDWATQIIANNRHAANDEAIRAAYAQSQQQEDEMMNEKEALVTQMRTENEEMTQRLNKLVLLTKMRSRLKRVVSERRERKAAEAACAEEGSGALEVETATSNEDTPPETERPAPMSTESSSPREEQKRAIVNELHSLIGLPEISHLRTFKPLSADARRERRQEELERELEQARREAEELRAAVQDMEVALQGSNVNSFSSDQAPEEDMTQLKAELERLREELAMERQMSSRQMGPVEFEDEDIITTLRKSLQGLNNGDEDLLNKALGREEEPTGAPRGTSSPRRKLLSSQSSGDSASESDDGVWL